MYVCMYVCMYTYTYTYIYIYIHVKVKVQRHDGNSSPAPARPGCQFPALGSPQPRPPTDRPRLPRRSRREAGRPWRHKDGLPMFSSG